MTSLRHDTATVAVAAETSAALTAGARRLEWLTVTWNAVEAVVAVALGVVAGSVALVGFGFDSTIEVFAASVTLWHLRDGADTARERVALRLIAVSFVVMATYVAAEAVGKLATATGPEASPAGVLLAAVAFVFSSWLARRKATVGRALGSATLVADAAQTRLCAALSAVLLVGLGANVAFGWWWADPAAALVAAAFACREGAATWREARSL